MRIKFEIGIRVLEAEVIEFEIVFQTSLSPSLSLFYPFKYHLFRVDREFLFLIIRKIFFNRVIINYSIRVDARISPERKRVIYFPLISLLIFSFFHFSFFSKKEENLEEREKNVKFQFSTWKDVIFFVIDRR